MQLVHAAQAGCTAPRQVAYYLAKISHCCACTDCCTLLPTTVLATESILNCTGCSVNCCCRGVAQFSYNGAATKTNTWKWSGGNWSALASVWPQLLSLSASVVSPILSLPILSFSSFPRAAAHVCPLLRRTNGRSHATANLSTGNSQQNINFHSR